MKQANPIDYLGSVWAPSAAKSSSSSGPSQGPRPADATIASTEAAQSVELDPGDVQVFEHEVLGEGAAGIVVKGKLKVCAP